MRYKPLIIQRFHGQLTKSAEDQKRIFDKEVSKLEVAGIPSIIGFEKRVVETSDLVSVAGRRMRSDTLVCEDRLTSMLSPWIPDGREGQ
jgi:hypothetical protein